MSRSLEAALVQLLLLKWVMVLPISGCLHCQPEPCGQEKPQGFCVLTLQVGLKLRLGDLLDEEDSFEVWMHRWV